MGGRKTQAIDAKVKSKRAATPKKASSVKKTAVTQGEAKKLKAMESLVATISRGKHMWEATFDALTSPVLILGSDYEIKRANKAAAKAMHLDVRDTIHKTCYKELAGRDSPCEACPLAITRQTGESKIQVLERRMKNARHYEVHAYPLDLSDEAPQTIMHYRDITEERELQSRLIQSEKMAAIGMLAGGVAHEINNPLGGILAFAQLAMRELPPEHTSYHDLKEIEEAALRCKRIVQDLLDFSRQNKDDARAPLGLNEVLKKIIPLIRVQVRNSQIELKSELGEALPQVYGNAHKLQQVFLNLITNAYQAMGKKGGKLTLKTERDEKGGVSVRIADTGPGISPENIGKIFDPYFTTKPQGEGTGLGLSITYGIIKEHGGNIQVESVLGQGTVFIVSFPLERSI